MFFMSSDVSTELQSAWLGLKDENLYHENIQMYNNGLSFTALHCMPLICQTSVVILPHRLKCSFPLYPFVS